MKNIDRDKLSKEIYDTVLHRKCVIRSGLYLATYLKHLGKEELAKQLIQRCLVHDLSKLENFQEFAALSSIINQNEAMRNVANVLTDSQKEVIKIHWKNNRHHPEYHETPNGMSELDMLEMACDLHARSKQWKTNLLEYVVIQQKQRFHFDDWHYSHLYKACTILNDMTVNDNYEDIFINDISFYFDIKDPAISTLENFNDGSYVNMIETDRLILTKSKKSDFSQVIYSIKLKDTLKTIGEITILCNGKIYYYIPKKFQNFGYIRESLNKFKEIIKRKELSLEAGEENLLEQQVAKDIGFVPTEDVLQGIRTYKFTRN